MNSHTPGPWKLIDRRDLIKPSPNPYFEIKANLGFFPEGFILGGIVSLADANLIVAAPDLLEACKLALAYLQFSGFKDGDAYSALVKAIAKAEGK